MSYQYYKLRTTLENVEVKNLYIVGYWIYKMAVSLLNLDASDLSVEVHTLVHIQDF